MKRVITASAFCAVTTLSLLLLFPRVADARPCQVEETYFYDGSCDQLVGHSYVDCNGTCQNCWGDQTYNNYRTYHYCCGNVSCTPEGEACGDAGFLGCDAEGACTSC